VNAANDIAEFLATRRAKITPEQAGLPSYGKRRVPGLRREEVASLAGVSADYYRRLERGQVSGVSELVLEALARALQLDDAERAHLLDLARAASPVAPQRSRPPKRRVRPIVQRLLDQIEAPALVSNAHAPRPRTRVWHETSRETTACLCPEVRVERAPWTRASASSPWASSTSGTRRGLLGGRKGSMVASRLAVASPGLL
jgi:transcriptional regulator with XRE-family HTH domain